AVTVCVIRQAYFPDDPRVRKEVRALLSHGFSVDVVCLRRPEEPARESWGAAHVHRLSMERRRRGVASYLLQYGGFLVRAFARVSRLHLQRRFRLVQVNTMPDALVFAALVPKLTGARIVLDVHELMPELFGALFTKRRGGTLMRRWLLVVEWL